jgi:hypothetical protein
METPKKEIADKRDDVASLLSFERNSPPAPVDVFAFARRAGEIIASAVRAPRGKLFKR